MEIFGFMNSMSTSCTWMLLSGRITSKNITKQGENPPFFRRVGGSKLHTRMSQFSIMGFGGWRCFWCETTAKCVLPSFTKDSTSQKKNTDLHRNNIPLDHIRSIYQPFTHTQRRGIWISKALKVGRSWVQRSRCVTLERSPLMSGR